MKLRKFQLLILLLQFSFSFSQISISESFNNSINDTLKPLKRENLKIKEVCKILNLQPSFYSSKHKVDFDNLFFDLKKSINTIVKRNDKINAYYTLMTYSMNNFEEYENNISYPDSIIKYIGNDIKGNEVNLITTYTILSNHNLSNDNFEVALNYCNEALKLFNKTPKNKQHFFVNIYNSFGNIYKYTYQFDKSNYYLQKANTVVDSNSNYYKDYYRFTNKDLIVENKILKFLQEKDNLLLDQASKIQKEILINNPKDEWLSKWHLHNSYIYYFKNDFAEAQKELSKSNSIKHKKRNWKIMDSYYSTIEALIDFKIGNEEKAIRIIENNTIDEYFENLLYTEVYNYYKKNGNYHKANVYLEKLLASRAFENLYKNKGEILIAQNKHNVREKEIEIENLKEIATIRKVKHRLQIAVLILAIILIFIFLIQITRRQQIKKTEEKKKYQQKIKFIKKSLKNAENKILNERKKIGISIHNTLLGNIITLQYQVKHFITNTKNDKILKELIYIEKELSLIYKDARNFSHSLASVSKKNNSEDIFFYLEDIKKKFNKMNLLNINIEIEESTKNQILTLKNRQITQKLIPVIKETISNTIKHTNSKNYTLKFEIINENKLIIKIINDGVLLTNSKNKKPGIGLTSLRKEIEEINGFFETKLLQSGFEININFPIS